jgi:PucR C-terminal helix-turn-helix domain/GAF domain/GGDEF-like domain
MGEAIDELPVAEELPDGQLPESVDDVTLYTEYRRITADQAALRRLATLVARGAEPAEVFEAVVNEMRRCASADTAGLWRYEPNDEMTKLAAAEHPGLHLAKWPVGTRSPVDGSTLAGIVRRTGRPARMDSYENSTGSLAARIRDAGVHAAVGVPVVVDGRVWGLAAVGSVEPKPMPADTEVRISAFAELIGTVVVAGHSDEQKRQLLTEASQLSNRLDGLVAGRDFGDWSLRDIAGFLRLPTNGPFVVIAAQVSVAGEEPLPDIESKLRSLNISSAWSLLPDLQVGVARVTSDEKLDATVALMSRMTTARVGVSAPFEDLRETPTALHVARMMLRGRGDSGSSVAVFDNSILAAAVVSAPEAMIRTVGPALDGFSDLPDEEREMLFETFRVWQDNDACVRDAAEALFCHPNTVRYRLRKIEVRSGRSLSRPKDVVELYLAFEVHRRLM